MYVVPLSSPEGPFGIEVVPGNEVGMRTVCLTDHGWVVVSHAASYHLEQEFGTGWPYKTTGKVKAFAAEINAKSKAAFKAGDKLERV